VVLVETVGTGQSEVEIAALAHACLVLCAPGAGDEIQAIKAGILEIADVLVVNKADQPQAAQTAAQLEAMLALRAPGARPVPVRCTVATRGDGVAELLAQALQAAGRGRASARAGGALRRLLADAAAQAVQRSLLAADGDAVDALCARVAAGAIGLEEAAWQAVRRLAAPPP
jgi:LAO/AO transport system kinase